MQQPACWEHQTPSHHCEIAIVNEISRFKEVSQTFPVQKAKCKIERLEKDNVKLQLTSWKLNNTIHRLRWPDQSVVGLNENNDDVKGEYTMTPKSKNKHQMRTVDLTG